ncbi:GTPase domain-containing protein [Morganella psychrotolerans]|uniref:GTPase domain-containing protein n=1 Tax=Morganella psychrotolerans TaxID=368603 RepID=UPI00168B2178|nr:GTPase domain-containing protein [Morganella psychrotolerans]
MFNKIIAIMAEIVIDASIALTLTVEVYNRRKPIFDAVSNWYIEKFETDIVVTGSGNVGKSTLADRLTSALYEKNFTPPDKHSSNIEHALIRINGEIRPKKLVILPGQVGLESYKDGIKTHLVNGVRTSGLIYVVDWGYRVPREQYSQLRLIADGLDSIERLAEDYRKKELKHFADTMLHASVSGINWLFIVINKCDLFPNRIGEVINYYEESFSPIINQYCKEIKVEFMPMISVHRALSFNKCNLISTVNAIYTQKTMLETFLKKLAECNFR